MNTTPEPLTYRQSFTISGHVLKVHPLKQTARGNVPCFSFLVRADDPDVGFMIVRCGWLGDDAAGYAHLISEGDPIIVHGSLYLQPWIDKGAEGNLQVPRPGICLRVTEILTDVIAPDSTTIDMDAIVEQRTLVEEANKQPSLQFRLRGVNGQGNWFNAYAIFRGEKAVEQHRHVAPNDRVHVQGPVQVLSRVLDNEVDCSV